MNWYKTSNERKIMTQKEMLTKFLPQLKNAQTYTKFAEVLVRPAKPGETITTNTSDGKETVNTAKENDFVVKNATQTQEEYIINKEKLYSRYTKIEDKNPPWSKWKAKGKIKAIQYNGPNMQFIASWNENMTLKTGDILATPLPNMNEIYRIAKKEFEETYKL